MDEDRLILYRKGKLYEARRRQPNTKYCDMCSCSIRGGCDLHKTKYRNVCTLNHLYWVEVEP